MKCMRKSDGLTAQPNPLTVLWFQRLQIWHLNCLFIISLSLSHTSLQTEYTVGTAFQILAAFTFAFHTYYYYLIHQVFLPSTHILLIKIFGLFYTYTNFVLVYSIRLIQSSFISSTQKNLMESIISMLIVLFSILLSKGKR